MNAYRIVVTVQKSFLVSVTTNLTKTTSLEMLQLIYHFSKINVQQLQFSVERLKRSVIDISNIRCTCRLLNSLLWELNLIDNCVIAVPLRAFLFRFIIKYYTFSSVDCFFSIIKLVTMDHFHKWRLF